jgi:hypothetical protein
MIGALIVAMVSLPGESWGMRCERPDLSGASDRPLAARNGSSANRTLVVRNKALANSGADPRGFMDVTVVVPTETPLTLVLSDTKGKVISTMDLGHVWEGTHHVYMNTGRLASGVYLLFADGLEDYLEARIVVAR